MATPRRGPGVLRAVRREAPSTGTSEFAAQALFLNHVLVNPPVDRKKPMHEVADVFIHVVEERDDGIVVSGAKMLATGSAITHATFVAQNSSVDLEEGKAEDYALVFIAPMDTPGGKLALPRLVRAGRRAARSITRSPAASTRTTPCWCSTTPSSRGRTCSSTATSKRANVLLPALRLLQPLQPAVGARGSAVKLDFMAGLLAQGDRRRTARDEFRGVQVAARRGDRLAQPHLGADDGAVPRPAAGPGRQRDPEDRVRRRSSACSGPSAWPRDHEIFETYARRRAARRPVEPRRTC